MQTKFLQQRARVQVLLLGILCVLGSFLGGITTAGDVRTIASLEAWTALGDGDLTGDGRMTLDDAIRILEIARGHRDVTPQDLRADPNGDGEITVDDALQLLHLL